MSPQKKIIFFAALILIAMKATSANAATYYVANSGNDTNSGASESTPWKTIAKVNSSSFSPGDNILFKKGDTFREQLTVPSSGTDGHPITFGAYGSGNKPVISGADLILSWAIDAQQNCWKATLSTEPLVVSFDGEVGTRESIKTSLNAEKEWHWANGILYVYGTQNPSITYITPGIEASSRNKALVVINKSYVKIDGLNFAGCNGSTYSALDVYGSDYFTMQNSMVEKNSGNGLTVTKSKFININHNTMIGQNIAANLVGIKITSYANGNECHSAQIDHNTVSAWPFVGILLYGSDATNYRITQSKVQYNTSFDNGTGIYLQRASNAQVDHNNCYDNRQTIVTAEQYGIGIQSTNNSIFEYNIMNHNLLQGTEIWGGTGTGEGDSNGNILRYNVIKNNTREGIFFSSDYSINTQMYGNLIYGNGSVGIWVLHQTAGSTINNNTIYGNSSDGILFSTNYGGNFGVTMKNNIISNNIGYAVQATSASSNITHSNNLYYKSSGNSVIFNGSTYTNATITNFEQTAVGANPQLTDPAVADFHLLSTSPVINKGTNVGLTQDYEGTTIPQGSAPDIGTYEYSSAPTYSSADLNQDTLVNVTDLGILMSDFGKAAASATNSRSDINSDGNVNVMDLGILMSEWGS